MALKINYNKKYFYECMELQNENGEHAVKTETVNFPACYVMVGSVKGDKFKVTAQYKYFADSTKSRVLQTKSISFTPTMQYNFVEDTYRYLKTLDEFKDAEDC